MQQGRVLTDDDWNENERIEDDDSRHSRVDIIGPFGSPDDGFKIKPFLDGLGQPIDLNSGGFVDFLIGAGTLYLGGLRLEMEADEAFRLQSDWLEQAKDPDAALPPLNPNGQFDLVYIEAWQQPVSAIEDNSLFEVALGGPDTSVRVKNMRRVKLARNVGVEDCADAWAKLLGDWSTTKLGKLNGAFQRAPDTRMTVSFSNDNLPKDLCSPTISGSYLGAENQAIRVQLVGQDKFTWGFDNASPYYRVLLVQGRDRFKMLTEPKDQYHWPVSKQVVEILPWSAVLPNGEKVAEESGHLTKVNASYDPDTGEFTILDPLPTPPPFGEEWKNRADAGSLQELDANGAPVNHFYLRVWNRGDDLDSSPSIPIPVAPATAVLGNTGLEVSFSGNDRVPNDYWVIAARPASPNLVVPWELEKGTGPHGVKRFFAPLAVISWTVNAGGAISGKIIHDCRKKFHPLTEQECCCTFTVGDGVRSHGDYDSIQEAIDNLPTEGGKICVLRGIHEAAVDIFKKRKIHIAGCGEQSLVRIPAGIGKPIFTIRHSQKIRVDNLNLVAIDGIAIKVIDDQPNETPSSEITIRENRILACIHAVRVELRQNLGSGNNIKIAYNQIGMFDKENGDVAIFSLADDVLIERNRIVMISVERDPGDPNPNPPPGDPFDPCAKLKDIYARKKRFREMVNLYQLYVGSYVYGMASRTYKSLGGIQIGCGSDKVWILQNEIMGGAGNGITLGHLEDEQKKSADRIIEYTHSLYDITIEENLIVEMGLSGIGTVIHLLQKGKTAVIYCNKLLICENTIRFCVSDNSVAASGREEKQVVDREVPPAAISLVYVTDCIIRENWLEENGQNQSHTICGVFVFFADRIDLSGNRVVNNGPDLQLSLPLNLRVRGGIVIWYATALARRKTIVSGNRDEAKLKKALIGRVQVSPDAIPAVKVHDNIVTQPIGHSLFIVAYGPVSVVANQLTSQGINKQEFFSLLAGTVFIFNLGISKDFLNILFMRLKNFGFVNPSMVAALVTSARGSKNPLVAQLQEAPNGRTMFGNNQVLLDMRSTDSDFCLSSILAFSLDDINFVSNQSECAAFVSLVDGQDGGLTFDIAAFNTMLFGVSTRCNDNRFTDGFSMTLYSLLSIALMSTAVGNQSTHCLLVPFLAFRRKALNIELNGNLCKDDSPAFTKYNKASRYFKDVQYNSASA
jgi:hypothetical protein